MEETRKINLKNKMKDKWVRVNAIQKYIKREKQKIFSCLSLLEPLESKILEGDEEVCQKAYEIIDQNYKIEPIKIHEKFEEEFEEGERDEYDDLKLMMWTIKKLGGINRAYKVFNAAKAALVSILQED